MAMAKTMAASIANGTATAPAAAISWGVATGATVGDTIQSAYVPAPENAPAAMLRVSDPVELLCAVMTPTICTPAGSDALAMTSVCPGTNSFPGWIVKVRGPSPTDTLVVLVALVPGALIALVALAVAAV